MGDGYPIVLIMGLTANMDWWDPELVDARSRKYHVLMFDNRGAGHIPEAKLIEYKGSGHGFMSQERNAFIKDLLAFLALKRN